MYHISLFQEPLQVTYYLEYILAPPLAYGLMGLYVLYYSTHRNRFYITCRVVPLLCSSEKYLNCSFMLKVLSNLNSKFTSEKISRKSSI